MTQATRKEKQEEIQMQAACVRVLTQAIKDHPEHADEYRAAILRAEQGAQGDK